MRGVPFRNTLLELRDRELPRVPVLLSPKRTYVLLSRLHSSNPKSAFLPQVVEENTPLMMDVSGEYLM
jgi:hypothetical protein